MSEMLYRLIPAELSTTISEEQALSAVEYLKAEVGTEDVVYVIAETPMFVECGDMLHYIGCPHCRKKLSFPWWAEQMTRCAETGFMVRDIVFPCCNREGKLEDIDYQEPCGLARIIFEIHEPQLPIDSEIINTLQLVLGCKLRVIQARY